MDDLVLYWEGAILIWKLSYRLPKLRTGLDAFVSSFVFFFRFFLSGQALDQRNHRCGFLNALGIPKIEFAFYVIHVISQELPSCTPGSNCPQDWIRDLEIETNTINASYTNLVLGFRLTGSIIAGFVFCYFFIRLRDNWRPDLTGSPGVTMEQKWVVILLASLLLDNSLALPFLSSLSF